MGAVCLWRSPFLGVAQHDPVLHLSARASRVSIVCCRQMVVGHCFYRLYFISCLVQLSGIQKAFHILQRQLRVIFISFNVHFQFVVHCDFCLSVSFHPSVCLPFRLSVFLSDWKNLYWHFTDGEIYSTILSVTLGYLVKCFFMTLLDMKMESDKIK